jgi:putative inorganic carbon (hco3(-)) transporter
MVYKTRYVLPQNSPNAAFPFALWALWLFIIVAVGRIGEIIPGLAAVPLAKIVGIACLFGILAHKKAWSTKRLLSHPIPRSALALFALATLSVLFSVWKSASLAFLFGTVLVVAIGFVLTVKLADSRSALVVTLFVLVVAGLLQSIAAIIGGQARISAGQSYDTNDLAYLLVTVLPLALAFAVRSSSAIQRGWCVLLSTLLALGILLTQSRGGLLALVAIIGYLVVRPLPRALPPAAGNLNAGVLRRVVIVVFAAALAWVALPNAAKERLATLTTLRSDYNTDTTLETGRLAIWERNSKAVLSRPIGFGLAAFGVVDMRTGGRFKAPHNSVLEVLVELGFVGVAIYLRLHWLAWRSLSNAKSNDLDSVVFCRALKASLVGNFVAGFFLSQAYSNLLWTLFAVITLASWHYTTAQAETPARPRRSRRT